jgi:predicted dehydrogenase
MRPDDRSCAKERQNAVVFQNRRWDGDFLTVKQLMDEGKLGDVRWIEMAWQKFGPSGGWRGQSPAKAAGAFTTWART